MTTLSRFQSSSTHVILESLIPSLKSNDHTKVATALTAFIDLQPKNEQKVLLMIINNNLIELFVNCVVQSNSNKTAALKALQQLLEESFDETMGVIMNMSSNHMTVFGALAHWFVVPFENFFCYQLLSDTPHKKRFFEKLVSGFTSFWKALAEPNERLECLKMLLSVAEGKAEQFGHIKDSMFEVLLSIARLIEGEQAKPVMQFICKFGAGNLIAEQVQLVMHGNATGISFIFNLFVLIQCTDVDGAWEQDMQ